MVLTKAELLSMLQQEIRILLHLASKADASQLEYRPTPKQRSTLELLRYLTMMGPIHLRAALADTFDMNAWGEAWNAGEAKANTLSSDEASAAIAALPALFEELLAPVGDADLRAEIEMFGRKASRGSMIVNLVLTHYTAYRMQLFLYLKSSGREELNTLNLWVGRDTL